LIVQSIWRSFSTTASFSFSLLGLSLSCKDIYHKTLLILGKIRKTKNSKKNKKRQNIYTQILEFGFIVFFKFPIPEFFFYPLLSSVQNKTNSNSRVYYSDKL